MVKKYTASTKVYVQHTLGKFYQKIIAERIVEEYELFITILYAYKIYYLVLGPDE